MQRNRHLPFEKLNKACDGDDGNRLQEYEWQGRIPERQNIIERGQNRSFLERSQKVAGSDCSVVRSAAEVG